MQWVVQLTTFAVNYLGHPFNQSLTENKGLALALRWGTIGFIVATTNIVPGTDWALSLVSSVLQNFYDPEQICTLQLPYIKEGKIVFQETFRSLPSKYVVVTMWKCHTQHLPRSL